MNRDSIDRTRSPRAGRGWTWLAALLVAGWGMGGAPAAALELRPPDTNSIPIRLETNDVWVMAGDSITEQRLHTSYLEAFFRTRYPGLALRFRNAGVGGDTAERVVQRFERDIAAFRPTLVSFELGMNDAWIGWDRYRAGLEELIRRTRAIGARPLLISSSPVNDGSSMDDWQSERCCQIHPLTLTLQKIGKEQSAPVVDQFHALLGLWSSNKVPERLAKQIERGLASPWIASDPGCRKQLEALRVALEGLVKRQIVLGGDAVHPGPVGQYTMAAIILQQLGVDPRVSSVTLDYSGKIVRSEGCAIVDVARKGGTLVFSRRDAARPWPIERAHADAFLRLMPEATNLSQYRLAIEGLPAGPYGVRLDGQDVATLSAEELGRGWNMAGLKTGPIADQAEAIIAMIRDFQNRRVVAFRQASASSNPEALRVATDAMNADEMKLIEACRPPVTAVEVFPMAGRDKPE